MTKKPKSNAGRKSVVTAEVVAQLVAAFAVGANVEQSCYLAGISRDAYHNYCKKFPQFGHIKDRMDGTQGIIAWRRIVKFISECPDDDKALAEAWKVVEKQERSAQRRAEETPLLPGAPGSPRLTINMGPQMNINTKDLRDDELRRLSTGAAKIEDIIQERKDAGTPLT